MPMKRLMVVLSVGLLLLVLSACSGGGRSEKDQGNSTCYITPTQKCCVTCYPTPTPTLS